MPHRLVLHGRVLDSTRCPRCTFRHESCLCAEIPRVESRTRIVILRHHREQFRSSNSGRLAHLALPNSELRDLFGPERHSELTLGPGAWLLFPDGEPRTVAPIEPPRQLVVLDATWPQARRMRQRMSGLRGLPVLSLAPIGAAARMRKAPGPGQVSTIEAIAAALRLLEGAAIADPLDLLFDVVVARVRKSGRVIRDDVAPTAIESDEPEILG